MKIASIGQSGDMFIEFIEEWSQFAGGCNWYTFHPIMLEFEDDRSLGGYECTFIFLGIGFRWRWNHTETEMTKRLEQSMKDIEDGTYGAKRFGVKDQEETD